MNITPIFTTVRFAISRPATTALLAAVLLLPFTHFKPLMGLKLSEMCIVVSLMLVTLSIRRTKIIKLPALLTQSFALFLLVSVASWFVATIAVHTGSVEPRGFIYEVPFANLLTIGRFVFSLSIIWLVVQLVRDVSTARLIAKIHVIGGAFAAIIGLGLYAFSVCGFDITLPLFREFGGKAGVWGIRLAGPTYEPGAFGNYFVSVIPLTLAFYLSSTSHARRWLLAILIVQGLALGLTFSTGGLGCVLLASAILVFIGRHQISRQRLVSLVLIGGLLITGIAVVAYWASISYAGIYSMITKVGTESVSTRWDTNVYLLQMFLDRPLLGIGIGNFAHVFGSYTQGSNSALRDVFPADWRANNDYLTILAETGIVGFVCFCLLIASVLREIFRVIRQSSRIKGGLIYIGITSAVIGLLTQCWVAFTILNPYTWLLLGLLVASRYWLPSELPQSTEQG